MEKQYVLYKKSCNAYYGTLMWHTKNEYRYSLVRDIEEAKKFTISKANEVLKFIISRDDFEIKLYESKQPELKERGCKHE